MPEPGTGGLVVREWPSSSPCRPHTNITAWLEFSLTDGATAVQPCSSEGYPCTTNSHSHKNHLVFDKLSLSVCQAGVSLFSSSVGFCTKANIPLSPDSCKSDECNSVFISQASWENTVFNRHFN